MSYEKRKRALLSGLSLALCGLVALPTLSQAADGKKVLDTTCIACHSNAGNKAEPYTRISQLRKTPEGWALTINRMERNNGLKISDEDRRAVIRYLADTQGIAPSESAPYRYILEKDHNVAQNNPEEFGDMCTRCHSVGRIGLQRRTEDEWQLLVKTHMAIHPTLEFHALARDRDWYGAAQNETAPALAKMFAFSDPAWKTWQAAAKPQVSGSWAVAGYLPGKGEYTGTLRVSETSKDHFDVTLSGQYADGSALTGSGKSEVFTGYDWRGTLTVDGIKMRQVMAAAEDGSALTGRMYPVGDEELGGSINAYKGNAVAAVSPTYIKRGQTQEVTLTGLNLSGTVSLGSGIQVLKEISRGANRVTVLARANSNTAQGSRNVYVGTAKAPVQLAVFDSVQRVDVTPSESIARFGEDGGLVPKAKAQYRAVGYAAGADGQTGTDDDLRLGFVPAKWSVEAFDEVAEHDNDVKYAGTIDQHGIFTPGDAGPNPERKMSTNNVGNLNVVATVNDGQKMLQGKAHLMVTVPTFIKNTIQ